MLSAIVFYPPAGVLGDMTNANPPTLREVAERAGVHVTTASRALNPATSSLVRASTIRRVRAAARELRYRPNVIARGLKTARSMSVGMLLPDLTNPLFPPIVRGVEDVLAAAGYTTLIANTDNDPQRQVALFDSLRARQVDGFVVATARREDPLLAHAHRQGVRMVLVNRRVDRADIPAVIGDDQSGIGHAVHHLVELGHTRIAHIAGPLDTATGQARLRAYRQAMEEADLPADPALVAHAGAFTATEGARATHELLAAAGPSTIRQRGTRSRSTRPTAVVAANDMIALGCLDAFAEHHLRCPADLSLVGFNDTPFVDRLTPALTTIRVPHYQIGAEAARMLLERLTDPTLPAKVVTLPVQLVPRDSTAPPPA